MTNKFFIAVFQCKRVRSFWNKKLRNSFKRSTVKISVHFFIKKRLNKVFSIIYCSLHRSEIENIIVLLFIIERIKEFGHRLHHSLPNLLDRWTFESLYWSILICSQNMSIFSPMNGMTSNWQFPSFLASDK